MKLWSDFFDYVVPEISGCPQLLTVPYIRAAAIDFFGDTGVYTLTLDADNVVAGVASYDITLPANWDVAWVRSVRHNGTLLAPVSENALDQEGANWITATGTPLRYLQEDTASVRLVPIPTTAVSGGLVLRAVLRPSLASTGFSTDWVFDGWGEAIASGAKARLLALPGKPWSNPELALYHDSLYRKAVGRAIRDSNRSYTRSSGTIQMRPLG